MSTCHVPGWRHTSEPWTACPPHCPPLPVLSWGDGDETRHATSLCPWLHSALSQTVASVPNTDVICSYLLWKSKPKDCQLYLESRACSTEKQQLCTQQSRVCLVGPGGHEYPPDPAQHVRCACLLTSLIWEDNKLNKEQTIMEVYLQSVWYIFSHLVTGLLALCGSRPWEIQSWREWRWDRSGREEGSA